MPKKTDDKIYMFYEKGNKMCKADSFSSLGKLDPTLVWLLCWCTCQPTFYFLLMFPKIVSLRAN